MAKIVHRPKPEVVVAPDYNKVLQNLKPAQQAGIQARAEQEQARNRFEQSLQKAAGKGDQNTIGRSTTGDRLASGTNRGMEKNPTPRMDGLREAQGREGNRQPWSTSASSGIKEADNSVRSPGKNSEKISKSQEAKIRQSRETNTEHSLQNGFRAADSFKPANSEQDESSTDASLEGLACPSPLGLQETLSASTDAAPMARAGNASQFETIESMLNHLSLMTARYGPRDWTFEIQNEHSSLVSVSLAPAANGGWNVAVTAKEEDQSGAQQYLEELQSMLQDTDIASLCIKDRSTGQTQREEKTRS